jgi:SAM-dependent methyltransferase
VDPNQEVFDEVVDAFADLSLRAGEIEGLRRLRERLPGVSMLDLGVGTGRTGYTFAPLVERYVGLDYSPRMIARAEELLGREPSAELIVGDARDLAPIEGGFDFVLFSFNGIDAVDHEDRLRVLAEVRAKLNPDGLFLFSSHSLGALPLSARRRRGRHRAHRLPLQLLEFAADLRHGLGVRRANREIDLGAARQRGHAIVHDPAHSFRLAVYYVDPQVALDQLREAGLEPLAVIDETGREVDPAEPRRDAWLNYLCRPAG